MNKKWLSALNIILLTYINAPFFFVGITALHRLFYYSVSIIPFGYALWSGVKRDNNISNFFLYFLFYFILILLVPITTFSLDLQYIKESLRAFLNIIGTISCVLVFLNNKKKLGYSFNILALKAAVFYVLGTLIFIFVPSLRLFWQSIIMDFNTLELDVLEYITRFGFAGYSGFSFAFWISTCSILFCYVYLNEKLSERNSRFYILFLLLGSFFYGRIGFVFTVSAFSLFTMYLFFRGKRKLVRFFFFIIILTIGLGVLIYSTIPDSQPFIDWLLEPVFNFINTGKFESASTNDLGKFYDDFNPSDKTLFIGDGYWTNANGGYYGHTDVGWMRNIYYGGVFYMICQYMLVILLIGFVMAWMKRNNKNGYLFIPFLLFIQFIMFELKGDSAFLFLKQYIPVYIAFCYESKTCCSSDLILHKNGKKNIIGIKL